MNNRNLSILIALAATVSVAGMNNELTSSQQQEQMRWEQRIRVLSPAPCSDVKGRGEVQMEAKGLLQIAAHCYVLKKSRKGTVAEEVSLLPQGFSLDADGRGCFHLNADKLPHGPLTIQITGENEEDGVRDLYELQVYNTGGKRNKASGIPDTIPAAARGMKLAYSDDFDGPLSISRDGRGARYNAHKPTFGDFSGWPFSDPVGELNPFRQRDTYLIIRARKPQGSRGSTGLLASVDMDGKGYRATPPFYMECRLTAQSAPGTWPAFWTITNTSHGQGDELDVIEAYGGWGEGNPKSTGYWVTSHFWNQSDEEGKPLAHPGRLIPMTERGLKTSWSQSFHTYGLRVDGQFTIYYLDDREVWRHPTNSYSMLQPHVLLINYAIGGASGWKIDLERYGNMSEMYVDYVRVFEE
ncbi:MAG: glycoside hydrolase family 16 protein [Bacteroidaceae bacterium]|nr:glycoside hydrolase family 16 protein [Bacteroidaceae bacterium]